MHRTIYLNDDGQKLQRFTIDATSKVVETNLKFCAWKGCTLSGFATLKPGHKISFTPKDGSKAQVLRYTVKAIYLVYKQKEFKEWLNADNLQVTFTRQLNTPFVTITAIGSTSFFALEKKLKSVCEEMEKVEPGRFIVNTEKIAL